MQTSSLRQKFSLRLNTIALLAATFSLCSTPVQANYSDHPKAKVLIERLAKKNIDPAWVKSILSNAKQVPKLIRKEQKSAEKVKPWHSYREIFLQPGRISAGAAFIQENRETLARAEKEFGIPPHLIAAIFGVETRFGGYTGPHRVLDSLATQGFDHPRRTKFFFSELEHFFLLCDRYQLDPLALKGSYAGAMGIPQFMPSNYLRLALDYNKDEAVDLWEVNDAIGSAANYLLNFRGKNSGWKRNQPVTTRAIATRIPSKEIKWNQRKATYTKEQLEQWGIRSTLPIADGQKVGLLRLQGKGKWLYRIAFPNFYAIMSYNPRAKYAMAVHELSLEIKEAATSTLTSP